MRSLTSTSRPIQGIEHPGANAGDARRGTVGEGAGRLPNPWSARARPCRRANRRARHRWRSIQHRSLAKQLAKKGIRVNAVAPGPIWTPLQVAGGQLPGEMYKFGQETPLGRAGQPAELAPLYVMLASGELSYTDGSVFGANGGTRVVGRYPRVHRH